MKGGLALSCLVVFVDALAVPQTRRSVLGGVVSGGLVSAVGASEPKAQRVSVDFGPDPSGRATASAMFEVPESWAFLSDTNAAVSGGRRLVVYSDATNSDTNVFLLITPVRGDYTQLGSFGTLDAVQDTIVPRGPDIQSEVIASSSSAGRYNYEYTVQVPNQPKRHLRTIFTLMSDNIVTFNAQAREEDYTSDVATVLRDIAATFSTTKLSAA